MDLNKYREKTQKIHDNWVRFRVRGLINYESFEEAIQNEKLAVKASDIGNLDLCSLFCFLSDNKFDVVAEDMISHTHINFPVWELGEKQLSIQYKVDKKYEYGILSLTHWSRLRFVAVRIHSKTCGGCHKQEPSGRGSTSTERFKKCARCKQEYYCSVACQKQHWKTHKLICNTIE